METGPNHEANLLRRQLAALGTLSAISALMSASSAEDEVLRLVISAVPALVPCRMEGLRLDGTWSIPVDNARFDPKLLADELDRLAGSEGFLTSRDREWSWAFPLAAAGGAVGHVVVSAAAELDEHDLLVVRLLIQHAGMAVANVRLRAEQRALAAQLRDLGATLEGSTAVLDRARLRAERSLDVHRRLTEVAAAAEGPAGIARAVCALTGKRVAIEDRWGNLLAWSGPDEPRPYPKEATASRDALLRRIGCAQDPVHHGERLVSAARSGGQVFGLIALVGPDPPPGELDELILEYGATVLMLEFARLRSIAETETRLRRDVVEELLSGAPSDSMVERARALGHDLGQRHHVVVVAPAIGGEPDDAMFHAVRRAARDHCAGALLVSRPVGIVVLCAGDDRWVDLHAAVTRELAGHGRARVGVGGACDDLLGFRRSFEEAQLALRLQVATGGPPGVTSFAELGVYQLIGRTSDPTAVNAFVRQWLGAIIDYDAGRGAGLVPTLTAFLESGGSYDRTAAALGVHRSTLRYRLRRLQELSGLDLAEPDTRFNLQLATRAWATLRAVEGHP